MIYIYDQYYIIDYQYH